VIDRKVSQDGAPRRAYDTSLAIRFRIARRSTRINDERHVPVMRFGAGLSEHIVAVDFEI
jgi:hypothetical protein